MIIITEKFIRAQFFIITRSISFCHWYQCHDQPSCLWVCNVDSSPGFTPSSAAAWSSQPVRPTSCGSAYSPPSVLSSHLYLRLESLNYWIILMSMIVMMMIDNDKSDQTQVQGGSKEQPNNRVWSIIAFIIEFIAYNIIRHCHCNCIILRQRKQAHQFGF